MGADDGYTGAQLRGPQPELISAPSPGHAKGEAQPGAACPGSYQGPALELGVQHPGVVVMTLQPLKLPLLVLQGQTHHRVGLRGSAEHGFAQVTAHLQATAGSWGSKQEWKGAPGSSRH